MKSVFILLILTAMTSFAKPIAYMEEAKRVSSSIAGRVLSIEGVSSIGLTVCDYRTGHVFSDGDVYCVLVTVDDHIAVGRLAKLYKSGSRIQGINFWIQVRGASKPEPRMSGGG